MTRSAVRRHPAARVQPGQPHRFLAYPTTGVDRASPAVPGGVPGRRGRPWLAARRPGRKLRTSLAPTDCGEPSARRHGSDCYHPCQTACNRVQVDEAVGINAVERFLGDLAITHGWQLPQACPGHRSTRCRGRLRPCGLTAAYHLRRLGHRVTLRDSQPCPAGCCGTASALPAAARGARRGDRPNPGNRCRSGLRHAGRGSRRAALRARGRRRRAGGRAQLGRRTYLPAGDGARVLDAVRLLHDMEDAQPPELGRRSSSTAAETQPSTSPAWHDDSGRRNRSSSIAAPGSGCRRPRGSHRGRGRGRPLRWLSTITAVDAGEITVERMELDADGFPQPTGQIERLGADTVVLALGQESDLGLLEGARGGPSSPTVSSTSTHREQQANAVSSQVATWSTRPAPPPQPWGPDIGPR